MLVAVNRSNPPINQGKVEVGRSNLQNVIRMWTNDIVVHTLFFAKLLYIPTADVVISQQPDMVYMMRITRLVGYTPYRQTSLTSLTD